MNCLGPFRSQGTSLAATPARKRRVGRICAQKPTWGIPGSSGIVRCVEHAPKTPLLLHRCHWALGGQAVQHCPAEGGQGAGCVSGQTSAEQCTGEFSVSTQHTPCSSSSRCRPQGHQQHKGRPAAQGLKCLHAAAQGDRYIDAWILDKRLAKKPGTPLSNKPFHCRVGAATGSIR